MRLGAGIRDDIKALQHMRLPWWGVLYWMGACALITWPFYHSDRLDLAPPVLYSIAMLTIVTAIKWKWRRHVWFWGTITALVALHLLLVVVIPWTTKWIPAIVAIPIGVADVYVMLFAISAVRGAVEGLRAHRG